MLKYNLTYVVKIKNQYLILNVVFETAQINLLKECATMHNKQLFEVIRYFNTP